MDSDVCYVNSPLPQETAEKLKRIAAANGRAAGREAARMIIKQVARIKDPADCAPKNEGEDNQ